MGKEITADLGRNEYTKGWEERVSGIGREEINRLGRIKRNCEKTNNGGLGKKEFQVGREEYQVRKEGGGQEGWALVSGGGEGRNIRRSGRKMMDKRDGH
jgi:hypothetical protein